MADQCDVAGRLVHGAVESAGPDPIADVVKAHAVAAADEHAGCPDLLLQAFLEIRWLVIVYDCGRHDDGSRYPKGYGLIDGRFDALVAEPEDCELGNGWQVAEPRVAAQSLQLGITRINREYLAGEATFLKVGKRPGAHRLFPGRRADDSDGPGAEQCIEPVRHCCES